MLECHVDENNPDFVVTGREAHGAPAPVASHEVFSWECAPARITL